MPKKAARKDYKAEIIRLLAHWAQGTSHLHELRNCPDPVVRVVCDHMEEQQRICTSILASAAERSNYSKSRSADVDEEQFILRTAIEREIAQMTSEGSDSFPDSTYIEMEADELIAETSEAEGKPSTIVERLAAAYVQLQPRVKPSRQRNHQPTHYPMSH